MSEKLKPCPFCGSEDVELKLYGKLFEVECNHCYQPSWSYYIYKDKAIEAEQESRTRTRQEAIEYIQEWLKDEYALNGKDRIVLNMAIEALEQEPKWIPVTERLPEEGLTVLIFAEGGEIEFGQLTEYGWEWLAESIAGYWTEAEEVIAWQPLPKPYKESDGE